MVGLCGVAGSHQHDIDDMIKKLIYLGDEKTYKYSDSSVKIGSVFFKNYCEKQPFSTKDDSLLWIWGNLYGFDGPNGYNSKDNVNISNGEYCSRLYNEYGLEFVSNLNGVFAGILYNPKNKLISLFTDRLGTHPMFYTKSKENSLVFSTQIQSIPFYPTVNTDFDLNYLSHFFTFERIIGIKTILRNVEQVHPGSIVTYDFKSREISKKIYWSPSYKPKKRSDSKIIKEFSDLFRNIIKETIDENLTYGLYLSGGSDSRLILAMIKDVYPDINLTCYHMNEWMNREAKIAKKVAEICNSEFKLLKRDGDFLFKVLQKTSPISLFKSWFDHAHFVAFNQKTSNEVDIVLHGFYSDTILKRHQFLLKSLKIPILNENIYLPYYYKIKSFEKFLELYCNGYGNTGRGGKIPSYLLNFNKENMLSFFKKELKVTKFGINFNDVNYHSFDDFLHWWGFYPLTNSGYILYYSELQSNNSYTPFLDNRIIDFSISVIDDFFIRNDLNNKTIATINSELSKIPHASSNLPIKYPKLIHMFKGQLNIAKCKLFPKEKSQGSWGDTEEIFRNRSFVKDIIYRNEKIIRQCNFLNWDEVEKCYVDHVMGKNNTKQLVSLLTFLENPTTKFLLEKDIQ